MIIVGLTGGIGSGKSTASKIFEVLGVPVFASDKEGRLLLEEPDVVEKVVNTFGNSIIADGKIDRKRLAAIVFEKPDELVKLNEIVHPAIRSRFENWKKQKINYHYVINESAILFESGLYEQVDFSINVNAPLDIRIQRVVARDGINKMDVLSRVNNQMSDDERSNLANWTICNDGNCAIIPQIIMLNNKLMNI